MYDPLLLPELREMLIENDTRAMKEFCEVLYPGVVAENLEALTDDEVWQILSQTDGRKQAEIFEFFDIARQKELVEHVDRERLSGLIGHMAPDNRADLLERLDQSQVENMLPLLAQAERADIRKLLAYPEHSAGSIMTTDYASLPEGLTAGEALAQLRLQAPNRETIYYVYVIDEHRRLRGFLSLRKLILARPDTPIGNIVEKDVISVRVDEDQEEVARKIGRYDFIAMPVVDDQNRLVGIVTHDDVLDVVQEEATRDIQKVGGSEALDAPYFDVGFFPMIKKRGGWLAALFLGETLTATAMGHFEDEIKKAAVVALFVPLIISSGGNSGSQATSILIRSLALQEVKLRDWWRVFRIEFLSSAALGVFLGAIGFFRILLWYWLGWKDYDGHPFMIGATVWASLIGVVMFGSITGSMLPFILRKLGLDPATASAPFVATLVDVTGLVIYFTVASIILRGTLL